MRDELKPCPNSLSGKHKWLEHWGKNKDKPEQCILCNHLKSDLKARNTRAKNDGDT